MKNYFKENYKNIIVKILIIAFCIAVDLVTKSVVAKVFSRRFEDGNFENIVVIKNVLSFTYTENTGAAFSIFSGNVIFLAIFSIIMICAFILVDYWLKEKNGFWVVGFALVVGGAVGNMVDRIFLKYVRDFISFDFLPSFPICNLADVFITVGCVLFVIYLIIYLSKNKKQEGK